MQSCTHSVTVGTQVEQSKRGMRTDTKTGRTKWRTVKKDFTVLNAVKVLQQNSYPNWNRPQWAVENVKQFDTIRFTTAEQSGHSFSLSGWSHSASGNGPCSRQTTGNVRKWNIYRYIETVKRVHFRRHWGVRCIKMLHFSRLFMIDRRFGLEVHWVVREKRPLFGRFSVFKTCFMQGVYNIPHNVYSVICIVLFTAVLSKFSSFQFSAIH